MLSAGCWERVVLVSDVAHLRKGSQAKIMVDYVLTLGSTRLSNPSVSASGSGLEQMLGLVLDPFQFRKDNPQKSRAVQMNEERLKAMRERDGRWMSILQVTPLLDWNG